MLFEGDLEKDIEKLPLHTGEFKPTLPDDVHMDLYDYYRITYDNNYMGIFLYCLACYC